MSTVSAPVRVLTHLTLPSLFACLLTPALAQSPAPSPDLSPDLVAPRAAEPDARALPEQIITATRVATPVREVAADFTVLDRADIERAGPVGLPELLSQVPGIAISRNGGPTATSSLFIRGAESRFTAVFVDGVRVDSQSTGGAAWQALPLSQIERVEIVRGPAAAVYGSDALGGVVQVFTRRGETGLYPSVGVGFGSHGSLKLGAGVSGATGAVDYALNLGRETSRGFNVQPAANPDRDGWRSTSVSARLGWQMAPAHRLEATLLDSRQDVQYDGFDSPDDDHARQVLQTLGLNWAAQWSPNWTSRVSVGSSRDQYETTPSPYRTDTRVTSWLVQNVWKMDAHQFNVDLERRTDQLENDSTTPVDTERSQNGLALGYRVQLGSHSLQLNARHDRDSAFGGSTTGGVAWGWAFQPHWRVTAAAGTAFRAPTLFQRFSLYGVPSLEPETARNMEMGVRYEDGPHQAGLVLYRNRVRNLINYVSGPGDCANGTGDFAGCYGNTGRARLSGLTLSGASQLGPVQVHGSVDWLSPEDEDTGRQLARRPKRMASVAASMPWSGVRLGAELQWVGERFDDARNTRRLSPYTLVNLTAAATVSRDWSVQGRVQNLANRDYETARGYANGGRTLFMEVKYTPENLLP